MILKFRKNKIPQVPIIFMIPVDSKLQAAPGGQ